MHQCAQGGSAGVNLHTGGHAPYTPIADSAGTAIEVHPEFYGALLFRLAGEGTLVGTTISGNANATAYAIRSASGGTNLVIVNKDATQDLDITVQMPNYANSGNVMLLTQSSGGALP